MLTFPVEVKNALKSSAQVGGVKGVARYQGRSIDVLVKESGSIQFRAEGEVQSSGSVTAIGVGSSLVPKSKTDPLATFGQELALWRTVRVRTSEWAIPLGVFRITSAGDGFERYRSDQVMDWSVEVSVSDRFKQIRDDDFLSVDAPIAGKTVWSEIRRLSPIPVQQTMGDASVPAATTYETRLGAITTLLALLEAAPHLTREGVLTARPRDAWLTSTVPVFDIEGTISWSDEMTDEFYNQVQVTSSSNKAIVAYARISDNSNPLSVGRAGGRTYKHSSPIYETVAAAQSAANTILARVSSRRSRLVDVECTPEALLLELGDFGWMRDPSQQRAVLGEVSGITIPMSPTAPIRVQMIVAEER